MAYKRKIAADYNIMSPDDINSMIYSRYRQELGRETVERMQRQAENYDYYAGKQHRDEYGVLVKASELTRPPGVDYDPTRYATNYFKAIVDRKARWQMGGKHGISVPRKQIDDIADVLRDDYEPSAQQKRENDRAEKYEKLLYRLWDENRMRAKLVQAARDRLIADRVVCKIIYNDRTGKMRWIFRPDNEYIPVYSEDDFEELIAAHFVKSETYEMSTGEEVGAIRRQSYTLESEKAYVEEAIYHEGTLALLETVQEKTALGLNFIPVQEFPVNELLTETLGDSEISALREQNDVLNQMNEDAIDSMKFEMFSPIAVLNAPGAAEKLHIAPNALFEAVGGDGQSPEIKRVESGFKWKDAFKDQYMRVKAAMHEISGLPQIVAQELNFGGLNGEALQVLYHDIITDTEEHWLSWGYNLAELHEKTIRYMQARTHRPRFSYDRDVLTAIDGDYANEMRFVLPLPDNRKELVELLGDEIANGLESQKGAIERLGVENAQAKQQEIEMERSRARRTFDPYGVSTPESEKTEAEDE